MILNIFQLLGIVGLLLCLYEFIAMRHRGICAESEKVCKQARVDALGSNAEELIRALAEKAKGE